MLVYMVCVLYGNVFCLLMFNDLYYFGYGNLSFSLECSMLVEVVFDVNMVYGIFIVVIYDMCVNNLIVYNLVMFLLMNIGCLYICGIDLLYKGMIGCLMLVSIVVGILNLQDEINQIWFSCWLCQMVSLNVDYMWDELKLYVLSIGVLLLYGGLMFDDLVNWQYLVLYLMVSLCVLYWINLYLIVLVLLLNLFDWQYMIVYGYNMFGCIVFGKVSYMF